MDNMNENPNTGFPVNPFDQPGQNEQFQGLPDPTMKPTPAPSEQPAVEPQTPVQPQYPYPQQAPYPQQYPNPSQIPGQPQYPYPQQAQYPYPQQPPYPGQAQYPMQPPYPGQIPYGQNPYVQKPEIKETPEEKKKANILCWISLALFFGPSFLSQFMTTFLTKGSMEYSQFTKVFGTLAGACALGGLVLMIVARVKYPKNMFAKVLMWVIIGITIAIVVFTIVMALFVTVICSNEIRNCQG